MLLYYQYISGVPMVKRFNSVKAKFWKFEENTFPYRALLTHLTFQTNNAPHVEFDSEEDMYYSLVMTNPDGHLQNNEAEYLHWAV